jgi:hypothetical protein
VRNTAWTRAAALLSLALLGLTINCSTEYAGGTETGNPEVSACAALVFAAFDDTLSWTPRAYVPGGMFRLDSAGIYAGAVYRTPDGMLVKRWVERTDTIVGTQRIVTYTVFIDDTVLIHDTTLVPDTVVIDTAMSRVDTLYDTSYVVTGADTTRVVQTRYDTKTYVVLDTVPFVDTIYQIDTLFLFDTIVLFDTIPTDTTGITSLDSMPAISEPIDYTFSSGSPTSGRSVSGVELHYDAVNDTASIVVTMQSASYVITPTLSNMHVTNEVATNLVTKDMVSATGAVVQELYGDLDGDGALFGHGYQSIRFTHDYRRDTDTLYAAVDFDGGRDLDIATTRNNPVLSLLHQVRTSRVNRMTTYDRASAPVAGDTLRLRTAESISDSTLGLYTRSYLLSRGPDGYMGNDDTLESWTATVEYASGDIRRMEIVVTPETPLAPGIAPSTGTIQATIWMRNGSVGMLDSVSIDFGMGTVSGTYYRDGAAVDVMVVRSGCCIE